MINPASSYSETSGHGLVESIGITGILKLLDLFDEVGFLIVELFIFRSKCVKLGEEID